MSAFTDLASAQAALRATLAYTARVPALASLTDDGVHDHAHPTPSCNVDGRESRPKHEDGGLGPVPRRGIGQEMFSMCYQPRRP